MKFGLFHSVQLPDPSAQRRYYAEALDQVLKAEQLGFNSVWFTEHHFTRHGIVSATMSVLAYLAGNYFFGIYRTAWQYASIADAMSLASVVGLVSILLIGANVFLTPRP